MKKILSAVIAGIFLVAGCDAPPVENVFRKENRFPGGINVPVAFLSIEWAGKPRAFGSGWLIEGTNGVLFSAKHVTDIFIGDIVELGGKECKAFIAGHVYTCPVARVPDLRDAVVIRLDGQFDTDKMPEPYKIATEKVKVGETVFVQGFHPHPLDITKSNEREGFKDFSVPILKDFYEIRMADPSRKTEIVFDSLEAKVVSLDEHIHIDGEEHQSLGDLKYNKNGYIKVVTVRDHKFSFGGLSGGVVIRINSAGEPEAVGIVTAESLARLDYDEKGNLKNKIETIKIADTLLITPIYSVEDLYKYARTIR